METNLYGYMNSFNKSVHSCIPVCQALSRVWLHSLCTRWERRMLPYLGIWGTTIYRKWTTKPSLLWEVVCQMKRFWPNCESISSRCRFTLQTIKGICGRWNLLKQYWTMMGWCTNTLSYRTLTKKSFKALKKGMEPILAKNEDIAAKNTAYVSLRCILNDTSKGNVERILNPLIKWHTKPFLCEGLLGTDCKAGLNTTYIYRCLDNLNIWNNNATYNRYLQCLAEINKAYGNMEIVSSKASISQNLKLIDNDKLNKLKEQVSGYLKDKHN